MFKKTSNALTVQVIGCDVQIVWRIKNDETLVVIPVDQVGHLHEPNRSVHYFTVLFTR